MVHIRRILLILRTSRLIRKRTSPGKSIMRRANGLRVRERLPAQFRRKPSREVFEGAQLVAESDGGQWRRRVIVVEDDGEDGLGAAGVLDCLRGEEDVVLWRGFVVGPV